MGSYDPLPVHGEEEIERHYVYLFEDGRTILDTEKPFGESIRADMSRHSFYCPGPSRSVAAIIRNPLLAIRALRALRKK
jgi:hypothetical protein